MLRPVSASTQRPSLHVSTARACILYTVLTFAQKVVDLKGFKEQQLNNANAVFVMACYGMVGVPVMWLSDIAISMISLPGLQAGHRKYEGVGHDSKAY